MTLPDPFAIAVSSAQRLAALTGPAGRFTYRYDPVRNLPSRGYNIVRHCGAVWSMMDVYRVRPAPELMEAGRRAISYLLANHVREDRYRPGLCVVEDGSVKAGANALAVLALIGLSRHTGESSFLDVARGLARNLLAARKPDDDFIHKRDFETGVIADFHSDYYTGEALFALVALFETTGERIWLDPAMSLEESLARRNYGVPFQSHWCLYALERMQRCGASDLCYRHAQAIAEHILTHTQYRGSGRSTPVACRSEGLLAFLRLRLAVGADTAPVLSETCLGAIRENLALQLRHRHGDGSFYRGGDGERRTEVRIDYIQHNISAFLHYGEYQQATGRGSR